MVYEAFSQDVRHSKYLPDEGTPCLCHVSVHCAGAALLGPSRHALPDSSGVTPVTGVTMVTEQRLTTRDPHVVTDLRPRAVCPESP